MNQKEKKNLTLKNLILLCESWEKRAFEPNMEYFGGIANKEKDTLFVDKPNHCGISCCILGNAPSVEGLEIKKEDFSKDELFSYNIYSDRVFPSINGFSEDGWDFVFGVGWNDSREQGIKRMRYMIENELIPPAGWSFADTY